MLVGAQVAPGRSEKASPEDGDLHHPPFQNLRSQFSHPWGDLSVLQDDFSINLNREEARPI